MRNCIKCGGGFTRRAVSGIEIDSCENCGGLWLDAGELQQLAQMPVDGSTTLRQFSFADGAGRDDATKPCPGCGGKLAIAAFDNVSLEHCHHCDGLFIDKGELRKAMEVFHTKGNDARTIVALAKSVRMEGAIG